MVLVLVLVFMLLAGPAAPSAAVGGVLTCVDISVGVRIVVSAFGSLCCCYERKLCSCFRSCSCCYSLVFLLLLVPVAATSTKHTSFSGNIKLIGHEHITLSSFSSHTSSCPYTSSPLTN